MRKVLILALLVVMSTATAYAGEWGVGTTDYWFYPVGHSADIKLRGNFMPQNLVKLYFDFKDDGVSIGGFPFAKDFYAPFNIPTGDIVDGAVEAFGYPTWQIDGSGTVDPNTMGLIGYIIAKEDYDVDGYVIAVGNDTAYGGASSSLSPMLVATINVKTPLSNDVKPFVGFFYQNGEVKAGYALNIAYIDGEAGVSPVISGNKSVVVKWPLSDYYYGLAAGLGTATGSYSADFEMKGIPVGIELSHSWGKLTGRVAGFWLPTYITVDEKMSPATAELPYHTVVIGEAQKWSRSEWDLSAGGAIAGVAYKVIDTPQHTLDLGVYYSYIGGLTVKGAGPMKKADVNEHSVGIGLAYAFDFLGKPIVAPVVDPIIVPMP